MKYFSKETGGSRATFQPKNLLWWYNTSKYQMSQRGLGNWKLQIQHIQSSFTCGWLIWLSYCFSHSCCWKFYIFLSLPNYVIIPALLSALNRMKICRTQKVDFSEFSVVKHRDLTSNWDYCVENRIFPHIESLVYCKLYKTISWKLHHRNSTESDGWMDTHTLSACNFCHEDSREDLFARCVEWRPGLFLKLLKSSGVKKSHIFVYLASQL